MKDDCARRRGEGQGQQSAAPGHSCLRAIVRGGGGPTAPTLCKKGQPVICIDEFGPWGCSPIGGAPVSWVSRLKFAPAPPPLCDPALNHACYPISQWLPRPPPNSSTRAY